MKNTLDISLSYLILGGSIIRYIKLSKMKLIQNLINHHFISGYKREHRPT